MMTRGRRAATRGLADLPHDVLCQIMGASTQGDRVACMTACRSLMKAATAPGVWTRVCFTELDRSAVRFMERHRCPVVHVSTACPDDVAWFFEKLREMGVDCVRVLHVDLEPTPRMPSDFLRGIGAQTRLAHLRVTIEALEDPSEIYFCRNHCLTSLQTLEIVERTEGAKQLVVWWEASHARFHNLTSAIVDVGLADVMTGLRHMPRLRRLVYNFEPVEGGETYEDVELEGVDMDVLEFSVDCETDFATLGEQLGTARRVGGLVLHCHDEYVDLTGIDWTAVESLSLRMHTTRAEVKLDFEGVRASRRFRRIDLSIGAAWADNLEVATACRHTLFFTHVAAPRDWAVHLAADRLHLDLLPTACVHLGLL